MENTCTIKIYRDNELLKEFKNQESDGEAFGWMLRNQGNSIDYALRFGGYKVEVIDDKTGKVEYWKPYVNRADLYG